MIDVATIKKLKPKPNEIVIIEVPGAVSPSQRNDMVRLLTDTFVDLGLKNKILIFTEDIKINILDKEIIKKLISPEL